MRAEHQRDVPGDLVAGLDPARVLANLDALERRTGGPAGARRLAWTETWQAARELLRAKAQEAGLSVHVDRVANLWVSLPGASDDLVVLGSHLDSVPNGGRLDGALGVFGGLEVLRAIAASGQTPAKSLALVDWADEEGARFGRSLVGSSAFTGTLERDQLSDLSDVDGRRASDVLAEAGVDLGSLGQADPMLARIRAYLELHIEQGPILERASVPIAAVSGTIGISRDRLTFAGQTAHAGPTPMETRHDAFLAAAECAVAAERIAVDSGGRATCGRIDLSPGVPTAVAGVADLYVDLRHEQAAVLAAMHEGLRRAATAIAEARGCQLSREYVWSIEPRPFDATLVAAARAACGAVSGSEMTVVSGALHDAGELAPIVPTAMIFCASQGGLSHCPEEASRPADLLMSVHALGRLTMAALAA